MTFTFPKSALPPQPSLSERMQRDMVATEGFNKLRSLYLAARLSEQREYQAIRDAARKEQQAAEQAPAVREAEVEAKRQEDQKALLASLPDAASVLDDPFGQSLMSLEIEDE